VSGAHDGPVLPAAVTVRLLLALACLAVPAWVLATRWSTVLHDHPAYLVLLVALVVTGVVVAVRARRPRRAGRGRTAGRVAAALLLVGLLAATAWLRPFAATTTDPLAVDGLTTWELRPAGPPSEVGVVFYPGARVDPRAYLALLRPLADAGHLVVVVKPPLDIALLVGAAPFDDHPEVARWVVGGHSLGGTAAAMVDDPRVAGLLLWASYPAEDQSARDLPTLSVSGDRDGLATPDDIAATAPRLPAGARSVVVEGGVHAFFGDYGEQPGDGVPTVDRAAAQRQIVDASREFVGGIG
jgi:hypothetical protein